MHHTITIDTTADREIIDITDLVRDVLRDEGHDRDGGDHGNAGPGIATVVSQHTTCAVIVNENEHFLKSDILSYLDAAVPKDPTGRFGHNDLGRRPATVRDRKAIEENGCGGFGSVEEFMEAEPVNAHAHVQAVLCGNSVTFGVEERGELGLGMWQSVMFVELDGPRRRKVKVTVVR